MLTEIKNINKTLINNQMEITDKEIVDILHLYYPKIYNNICEHIQQQEQ